MYRSLSGVVADLGVGTGMLLVRHLTAAPPHRKSAGKVSDVFRRQRTISKPAQEVEQGARKPPNKVLYRKGVGDEVSMASTARQAGKSGLTKRYTRDLGDNLIASSSRRNYRGIRQGAFITRDNTAFVMKQNTDCSRADHAMHKRRPPFVFGLRNTAVPIQTSPFENGGRRSWMVCNIFANGGVLTSTRTGPGGEGARSGRRHHLDPE